MNAEKFNGWHKAGGLLALLGLGWLASAMRAVSAADETTLYWTGLVHVVAALLLVLVGCLKWDRGYVEYDEDGEPVRVEAAARVRVKGD